MASLTPEAREEFENVWCERTIKQGWSELSATTALEEAACYPEHKRMKSDYAKAINRRYVPDTSKQATPLEDAQLQLAPLHTADLVMDPAVRTNIITLKGHRSALQTQVRSRASTSAALWA